jgi:hypothetical protein
MAIQNKTLEGAEHDWYATRSAAPINAPLSQHQRDYWEARGSKNEREWLQTVGSSTSIDPYELWVAACQAQSVPVGESINDCKFRFFTTVAAGTNP